MVTLQILNKALLTGSPKLILENNLTEEHFIGYENEFNFLLEHWQKYAKLPDKETFIAAFPEFSLIDVAENDKYLIETLQEEYLYYKSVGVVQNVAKLLKTSSTDAIDYLRSQLPSLKIEAGNGIDIVRQAEQRLELHKKKLNSPTPWYIPTGFEELDTMLNGWAKGEELAVIFARTGQGKSWVLVKTITHAWQVGYRVGYISPEMSSDKIGYRFDTITQHFSNQNLVWGKEEPEYENYIDSLKNQKIPFIVATPTDFDKKITVSRLRQFIESNSLDILGIDGITYMTDERYKKGDNKTTSLTNISEDLMGLSIALKIPILVVVQSNRGGTRDEETEGTPELENIRDSDGIAQNASKVIALRQSAAGLEFGVKKHRDGRTGGKVLYAWEPDIGNFVYIPSDEDAVRSDVRSKKKEEVKQSFKDREDVF